jgi:hypothetical protein
MLTGEKQLAISHSEAILLAPSSPNNKCKQGKCTLHSKNQLKWESYF